MGWFFNLFSYSGSADTSVELAVSPRRKDSNAELREFFAKDKVAAQIDVLIDLVNAFPAKPYHRSNTRKNINGIWPHRLPVNNQLLALKAAVRPTVIDIERSDAKILSDTLILCNETIPQKLRELEVQILQESWYGEEKTYVTIRNLISSELTKIATLPTKRSTLRTEGNEPTPEADAETSEDVTFPDITSYSNHVELHQSLVELKKDWETASDLPLDSEDSYIIEMVGRSYLPDALVLFDQFCKRTKAATNPKALAILTDQIKLIHQQVQLVLSQNEEDSLTAMQTHTEFLRMKNNQAGISNDKTLHLQKSSDLEDAS